MAYVVISGSLAVATTRHLVDGISRAARFGRTCVGVVRSVIEHGIELPCSEWHVRGAHPDLVLNGVAAALDRGCGVFQVRVGKPGGHRDDVCRRTELDSQMVQRGG